MAQQAFSLFSKCHEAHETGILHQRSDTSSKCVTLCQQLENTRSSWLSLLLSRNTCKKHISQFNKYQFDSVPEPKLAYRSACISKQFQRFSTSRWDHLQALGKELNQNVSTTTTVCKICYFSPTKHVFCLFCARKRHFSYNQVLAQGVQDKWKLLQFQI